MARDGGPAVDPAPRSVRSDGGNRLSSGVLAALVCVLTASAALVPLAVVGQFHAWIGLPLVAVASATLMALWRPDRPVVADAGGPRWFVPAALAVAALAVGPSLAFAGEHAVVDRDPGIYVNAAAFARSRGSLVIAPPSGPFADVPGIIQRTPAQPSLSDGSRGFQGLHLLPVQAGALGWVGGDALLLRASPLLAGAGLVLLMALGRRIVGAPLALVVGAALGASLPFAYLSRDLYSEWPVFALLAGGVWALDTALAERSVARAVVAGAALGAATMARIDGLVTVGGLVLVVGLWVVAGRGRDTDGRARRTRVALAVAAPAALGWSLGMVDGWTRSRAYVEAHTAEILGQLAIPLGALVLVVGATKLGQAGRRTTNPGKIERDPDATNLGRAGPRTTNPDEIQRDPEATELGRTASPDEIERDPMVAMANGVWVAPRAWALAAAGAVVVLGVLAVVVRPAWPSGAELPPSAITAGLQRAEGEALNPGRTYAELSGRWLVWYLGAATVAAAVVGAAVAVAAWARGRRVRVEALLAAVVGPPLVLYLARPSIYPDHPWASRRFLPVVLPGILVAAAWLARRLWGERRSAGWRGPAAGLAAVALAVAMVAHPVVVLAPLIRMRQHTDEVAMVRDLCAQVPTEAALLTVGLPAEGWVPALTTFCDRPVGGVVGPDQPDPAVVSRLARDWRGEGRPLWLVGPAGSVLTPLGARPAVSVGSEDDLVLRFSLTRRPGRTRTGRTVLVAGPVTSGAR